MLNVWGRVCGRRSCVNFCHEVLAGLRLRGRESGHFRPRRRDRDHPLEPQEEPKIRGAHAGQHSEHASPAVRPKQRFGQPRAKERGERDGGEEDGVDLARVAHAKRLGVHRDVHGVAPTETKQGGANGGGKVRLGAGRIRQEQHVHGLHHRRGHPRLLKPVFVDEAAPQDAAAPARNRAHTSDERQKHVVCDAGVAHTVGFVKAHYGECRGERVEADEPEQLEPSGLDGL
mmetsp:Transcript_26963/g.60311  ORF Transcript_26963/g.60311 Transcript_26963/m.60311 type:complete len:230 (+) Transcript_26963:260-949(+)